MKKNEVQVGKVYIAKINGRITKVHINEVVVRSGYGPNAKDRTHWKATNLTTGRKIELKSAVKLIREAIVQGPPSDKVVKFAEAKVRLGQIEAKYSTEQGATEEERQEAYGIVQDFYGV